MAVVSKFLTDLPTKTNPVNSDIVLIQDLEGGSTKTVSLSHLRNYIYNYEVPVLSATEFRATSAVFTNIDIKQYEVEGFSSTGNVSITGSVNIKGNLSITNDILSVSSIKLNKTSSSSPPTTLSGAGGIQWVDPITPFRASIYGSYPGTGTLNIALGVTDNSITEVASIRSTAIYFNVPIGISNSVGNTSNSTLIKRIGDFSSTGNGLQIRNSSDSEFDSLTAFNIIATNILTASAVRVQNGNSSNWNSVYTTVNGSSANNTLTTTLCAMSGNGVPFTMSFTRGLLTGIAWN